MEKQGLVSLWLGECESKQAWQKAIEFTVSEEGDFLGSGFSRGFGFKDYDPDYCEAVFRPKPRPSLKMTLHGISNSEEVIPLFEGQGVKLGATENCFILLYNFNFDGRCIEWSDTGIRLRFCGVVGPVSCHP